MSIVSEITRLQNAKSAIKTAIENKGVTVGNGTLDTYAGKINDIQTGGGSSAVVRKDVNFYDYDGTLLHSYTLAEIQALTELPELPTQQGLICQGWNWTLADIKAEGKETDVGAMYITDDGKTRLYIRIETTIAMNLPLRFQQTVRNGVEVDWGDGSNVETVNNIGSITMSHTYSSVGDYVITLKPLNNCILTLGHGYASNTVFGSYGYDNSVYRNDLKKVEFGQSITKIDGNTFNKYYSLETITIPNSIIELKNEFVSGCSSLKCFIIPSSVTIINNSSFYECYSLKNVVLSNSITSIGNSAFSYCKSLPKLLIPKTITSIGNGAFSSCESVVEYNFSEYTTIPTLGSSAFSSTGSLKKIIVPDNLYNDWIATSGWSTYASYIIKASEV